MKYLFLTFTVIFCLSCEDDELKKETRHTDGGWAYDYVHMPEKTDGWKIVFMAKSPWIYEDHNPWGAVLAPYMLYYSGYADVTPADKLAFYEDLDSNADLGQEKEVFTAYLYVEDGEEDEFMPEVISNFSAPNWDLDYFETVKDDFRNHLLEIESNSAAQSSHILTYALFQNSGMMLREDRMSMERLNALTIEDIEQWYNHIRELNGFKITVAGKKNPEILEPYIDQFMNEFSNEETAQEFRDDLFYDQGKIIVLENPDLEKIVIEMAAPWPKNENEQDRIATSIAANILGGNSETARLARIRDELRASYGFQGYRQNFNPYSNNLVISGESDLEHYEDVMKMLEEIVAGFKNSPIGQDEFDRVVEEISSRIEDLVEDENSLSYLMATDAHAPYPKEILKAQSVIDGSNYEEVAAQIQAKFPAWDQWSIVIITPDANQIQGDCYLKTPKDVKTCYSSVASAN